MKLFPGMAWRPGVLGVAPHAGAWIETWVGDPCAGNVRSPPTRGRGLKRTR